MKIYQLVAIGVSELFGSLHRFHSKRVFFSREHAEEYKDEFITLCTTMRDDYDLNNLESVREIKIVELELKE